MNTIWPCTGLKSTLTETALCTQVIHIVYLYLNCIGLCLLQFPYTVNFNVTKVEAKAGVRTLLWIRNFLGIVPGETAAHNCGYFSRSRNWVCSFSAGVNSQWRRPLCYSQSYSHATSCMNSSHSISVSGLCYVHISSQIMSHYSLLLLALAGCLLTIILLMRALDPLGYEKETLSHFQTLKVSSHLWDYIPF